jgi:hypothetical protein
MRRLKAVFAEVQNSQCGLSALEYLIIAVMLLVGFSGAMATLMQLLARLYVNYQSVISSPMI